MSPAVEATASPTGPAENGSLSEASLCAAFIAAVHTGRVNRKKWTCYPETAGFDLLAVCEDGRQVGIEAKLRLNTAVITQALPSYWDYAITGPDYRAVLVPHGKVTSGLETICTRLGVKVMYFAPGGQVIGKGGYPVKVLNTWLPEEPEAHSGWHEWCPVNRCPIPDYIPDVAAGASAPVKLTSWKVKAIKLAVLLEHRPVTRSDFKALNLDPSRWVDANMRWLLPTPNGYVRSDAMPDFKAQHPRNYEEIAADKAQWMKSAGITPSPLPVPAQ